MYSIYMSNFGYELDCLPDFQDALDKAIQTGYEFIITRDNVIVASFVRFGGGLRIKSELL